MPGLLNDQAKLYRRFPDNSEGVAQQEHELDGTVRECVAYLRQQPEAGRDCFFAELGDGTRLSAEEIERIAVNEGG